METVIEQYTFNHRQPVKWKTCKEKMIVEGGRSVENKSVCGFVVMDNLMVSTDSVCAEPCTFFPDLSVCLGP